MRDEGSERSRRDDRRRQLEDRGRDAAWRERGGRTAACGGDPVAEAGGSGTCDEGGGEQRRPAGDGPDDDGARRGQARLARKTASTRRRWEWAALRHSPMVVWARDDVCK